jgi:DNA modification methylase
VPELNDQERDEIIEAIRAGRSLPARYRASLFDDALETELIWPGKTTDVERVVLPFQSIEHIDEPRSGTVKQPDLFSFSEMSGRQTGGWTNKLIWGDNKLVLSSLAHGPLRKEIEDAGGLKLVYIDPPFDVGADFSVDVEVGSVNVNKAASVVEEIAYRDTWGKGRDSYASMLSERLRLIYGLLASNGSLFLHCDYRTSGITRLILDEIFGTENLLNEVVWLYGLGGSSSRYFPRKHDTIFWYCKSQDYYFNPPMVPATSQRMKGMDKKAPDYWDIPNINNMAEERLSYPTQKPEALLSRIVECASKPGDLVADFFCGSGTTLATAERLGRKWVGADLGRFAVHTTRKRLIGVQRELARQNKPYRAFEILNLGSYERQYFLGADKNSESNTEAAAASGAELRDKFIELVMSAYGGQKSEQLPGFDGVKGNASVLIGPLDAPVTEDAVRRAIDTAKKAGIARVDILGFEFEMGIKPVMQDTAKDEGVTLTLRYIPNDVFDKRAIAKGQVKFYDVGYLEVKPVQAKDGSVTVELEEFSVFYAQEDADAAASGLRNGGSRIVVDGGQVVRVAKDKKGLISKEILTKSWTDWIDYWAVDFDFESQQEIVSVVTDDVEKDVWTGRYIFENQWQDFRTKDSRELTRVSDKHTYDTPGEYKIAVKVVDVFGNDTTKVVKLKVK